MKQDHSTVNHTTIQNANENRKVQTYDTNEYQKSSGAKTDIFFQISHHIMDQFSINVLFSYIWYILLLWKDWKISMIYSKYNKEYLDPSF